MRLCKDGQCFDRLRVWTYEVLAPPPRRPELLDDHVAVLGVDNDFFYFFGKNTFLGKKFNLIWQKHIFCESLKSSVTIFHCPFLGFLSSHYWVCSTDKDGIVYATLNSLACLWLRNTFLFYFLLKGPLN